MMKSVRVFWAAGCLLLSTLAYATPVTWRINGVVDSPNLGAFFFPFALQQNDPIAFDLSFDSQTPCSTCEPQHSIYDNVLTSLTITARDTVFALPLDQSSLSLANDWGPQPVGGAFVDLFSINFNGTDPTSGIFFTGDFVLQRSSPTTPVLGIDQTTLAQLTPPDPGLFPNLEDNFFSFTASQGGGFDSFGGHQSTITAVPAPSELLLLAGGLLALAAVRTWPSARSRSAGRHTTTTLAESAHPNKFSLPPPSG
jgi:hypothetical protein